MKADFSKLWVLRSKVVNSIMVDLIAPQGVDPKSVGKGHETITEPLRFKRFDGTICNAELPTTSPYLRVFCRAFFELLREHGFTGWRVKPVSVESLPAGAASAYGLLIVKGRCGPLDPSVPHKAAKIGNPDDSRRILVGYYFSPDSWDGSDVFMPDNSSLLIVTSRVKDALDAANLKNLELGRLDTCLHVPVA